MSILKYLSIILVGLTATVCQAEIAIAVPPPEEQLEHPPALSGATPSEVELKVAPLILAIDLVDGSRIIGVPRITSVPVQTSYAKMDIPLEEIVSIRIEDDNEGASFGLVNGDKLRGVLDLEALELEAIFGKVSVGIEHVQSLRITARKRPVWSSPFGGNLLINEDLSSLSGPGEMAAEGAIAILDAEFSGNYEIEGECRITGRYGGFVLGYDSEDSTFISIYSDPANIATVYSHKGKTRTRISTQNPLQWPVDEWMPFRIRKQQRNVEIRFGRETLTVKIPNDRNGAQFGLMVYHSDSTITLRGMRISGERAQH